MGGVALVLDKKLKELAKSPVAEADILHTGSGFGKVELERMSLDGDAKAPESMLFPDSTVSERETPWLKLLTDGALPDEDGRYPTITFMTSEKWLPRIKAALDKSGWFGYYQYGIAIYEGTDNTVYASAACPDEDVERRATLAEDAWKKSVSIKPTYFAYRALAVLEKQRGNNTAALEYYKKGAEIEGAYDDFAFANEYIGLLLEMNMPKEAWDLYDSLPENVKSVDRVRVTVSGAAVKLNKLEWLKPFFSEDHPGIREGENTLTDVWFENEARRMARERGIIIDDEALDLLIDEAWETLEPPIHLDFRQSYNRKEKYRV